MEIINLLLEEIRFEAVQVVTKILSDFSHYGSSDYHSQDVESRFSAIAIRVSDQMGLQHAVITLGNDGIS